MSVSTRNYNEGELPGAGQVEVKRMLIFILVEPFTLRRLMWKGEFSQRRGEGSEVLQTCFIYPALPPTFWHPDLDVVPPLLVPQTPSRAVSHTPHTILPANPGLKHPGPGVQVLLPRTRVTLSKFLPLHTHSSNPHSTHTDTLTFSPVSALEGLVDPSRPALDPRHLLSPGRTNVLTPHPASPAEQTHLHTCVLPGRVGRGLPEPKGKGP